MPEEEVLSAAEKRWQAPLVDRVRQGVGFELVGVCSKESDHEPRPKEFLPLFDF